MENRNTFSPMFFIKKHRVNSNGEVPIYLRITINGKSTDMSMHRSIDSSHWDKTSGTIIGNNKIAREINNYLLSVNSSIYEHYKYLRETDKELTPISLKNAYLGIKKEEGKKVIELFEKHNTDIKKLAGIDYSPVTIKRYETSIRHTQNYILYKYGKYDMFLTELDLEFITAYEMYLKTVRKCNHNSTMKYLRNFKKIVRIALINGWLQKDPFVNYKIRLKKVDRGFLSDEELQILINKDFSVNRLSEIRDCFVFSCFTGLAHSDLKRLTNNNLVTGTDGDKWIKINRKKTDNLSSIPVLAMTQQIIDKYENNPYCIVNDVLLPVRSNQKMNAYLKEIADICEIKQDLTTHLARHTFATTVTLNNDVPIESVSKMLGHTSLKTTKIYARLLDKKVAHDMSKINDIYN